MITEALTFDDVLIRPNASSVMPNETNTSVNITKKISLKCIQREVCWRHHSINCDWLVTAFISIFLVKNKLLMTLP